MKIQFDERPGKIFPAVVSDISADNLTIAPPSWRSARSWRSAATKPAIATPRKHVSGARDIHAITPDPLCSARRAAPKSSGPTKPSAPASTATSAAPSACSGSGRSPAFALKAGLLANVKDSDD